MINHWKLEIPDTKVALMDATCYGVYIRFPTDAKLLWKSCEWLWDKQIPQICKNNKLKIPRSKFKSQKIKHLTYSKLRKKSHRKTRSRNNALLKLLEKSINAYQTLLNQTKAVDLTEKDAAKYSS
jgi:IS5 family transposase